MANETKQTEKCTYCGKNPKGGWEPSRYNPHDIAKKLRAYTDKENVPIIAEFAYKNEISKQALAYLTKTCQELLYEYQRALAKKEAQVEIGGLSGRYNGHFALASLKQREIGWTDKYNIEDESAKKQIGEIKSEITEWLNRVRAKSQKRLKKLAK